MLISHCNHINVNLGTTCRCVMCGEILNTNVDIDATEFMVEYGDNKFKVIQEMVKTILATNNHMLKRKLIHELNLTINNGNSVKVKTL